MNCLHFNVNLDLNEELHILRDGKILVEGYYEVLDRLLNNLTNNNLRTEQCLQIVFDAIQQLYAI